jgi:hypothetical protein
MMSNNGTNRILYHDIDAQTITGPSPCFTIGTRHSNATDLSTFILFFTIETTMQKFTRKADNCYRLWKIRTTFHTLNDAYENYYNPSELLAADEIIVKFKVRLNARVQEYVNFGHDKTTYHCADIGTCDVKG